MRRSSPEGKSEKGTIFTATRRMMAAVRTAQHRRAFDSELHAVIMNARARARWYVLTAVRSWLQPDARDPPARA